MALIAGTRIGPYEILSALGEGGMGEVYRARDGTLQRDVALKILPEVFASDPDRLARFRREAQLLAALNHPNIAAIYGLEESTSVHALVLELVEGPTLADRIAHGPIPVDEALPIATQIATALEAAHEQGIIHRDLKPANIKLRPDGTVKVLDFGLAKLSEASGVGRASGVGGAGEHPLSHSPTITSPAMLTGVGVILGTAAYMSPEQAKGREADKRSDIWAFGVVLYEMLTGRRPFHGEDVSDTLAAVLRGDPDVSVLPPAVPPHLRLLITRCLAKDRRQRTADMSVALFMMSEGAILPSAAPSSTTLATPPLWRRALVPVAALIVGAMVTGAAAWLATRSAPMAPRLTRFTITPTGAAAINVDLISRELAITPDGTRIVYVGASTGGSGGSQLFVRQFDQLEPTALTTPALLRSPFVSPDGQWVGFADVNGFILNKVAITGGPAIALCTFNGQTRGFTWGEDDTIVFGTSDPETGLQRVSGAGGKPTVLTRPDHRRGEADHVWPQFLPGAEAVLFTITPVTGGIDASQIALLDLRTGIQQILIRGGSQAHYMPSGHLVYAAAGGLRAIAFDLGRRQVLGNSVPVVPQVAATGNGAAKFDLSLDGTLVYLPDNGTGTGLRNLVWVDRQGRETPIAVPPRSYLYPRISPTDSTRIALDIRDGESDIWLLTLTTGALTRLTFNPGVDRNPVWTPDGNRVLFSSQGGGLQGRLSWQPANGTGTPEPLVAPSAGLQAPSTVSPDGTRVVFMDLQGLMVLTLDKDRRVEPLVQTPADERNAEISPDGHWIAYETNDSGAYEVFVRPFPNVNSGRYQISNGGGTRPLWAPNGRELFYISPTGALMSVSVTPGVPWSAGATTKLFEGPYYFESTNFGRTYDVSADGKRFLMIKPVGASGQSSAAASFIVVQNWLEDLKRLVPVN